jgi:hypothetical protein
VHLFPLAEMKAPSTNSSASRSAESSPSVKFPEHIASGRGGIAKGLLKEFRRQGLLSKAVPFGHGSTGPRLALGRFGHETYPYDLQSKASVVS